MLHRDSELSVFPEAARLPRGGRGRTGFRRHPHEPTIHHTAVTGSTAQRPRAPPVPEPANR